MAADIAPLTPVNPTPLVRKKRHFHGEYQQGSKHNSQSEAEEQAENPEVELKQDQNPENSPNDNPKSLNNSVNQDEKHATVRHLDEYV